MATVAKWVASLTSALVLGLSGLSAMASTNQALVEVHCVHLDAPADAYNDSGDFVSFRIENQAYVPFAPGAKAQAQGLYLMSELARSEVTCKVDGTPVTLRVVDYRSTKSGCYGDSLAESYQLELWIGGEVTLRTAAGKAQDTCDDWAADPFSGTIFVDASLVKFGRAEVCKDELMGVGGIQEPPPPGSDAAKKAAEENRKAEWRNKHTLEPFGLFPTAFYQRSCG